MGFFLGKSAVVRVGVPVAVGVLVFALSACSGGGAADVTPSPSVSVVKIDPPRECDGFTGVDPCDPNEVAAETVEAAQGLIGLSEADAEASAVAAGYAFRVTMRDGVFLTVTADYSPTRISVDVDGGVVVAVQAA
jgi:hypothetical protein